MRLYGVTGCGARGCGGEGGGGECGVEFQGLREWKKVGIGGGLGECVGVWGAGGLWWWGQNGWGFLPVVETRGWWLYRGV